MVLTTNKKHEVNYNKVYRGAYSDVALKPKPKEPVNFSTAESWIFDFYRIFTLDARV